MYRNSIQSLLLGLAITLLGATARADLTLVDGSSLARVTPEEVAQKVAPGSVLIVSEIHNLLEHHEFQWRMLETLGRQHPNVSVGMEFFEFPNQSDVDALLEGSLAESDFLKRIGMKPATFDSYRASVMFPKSHGGTTRALNAPRPLTSKISRSGIRSLTDLELGLLPQGFTLGNANYFTRFQNVMSGHVPPQAIQNYFEAQSVWDETMAAQAAAYLSSAPEQILVIIVGDFHAAYGGGLPDRLRARGVSRVSVISQVDVRGLSPEEQREVLEPHPTWGPRADWISVLRE